MAGLQNGSGGPTELTSGALIGSSLGPAPVA